MPVRCPFLPHAAIEITPLNATILPHLRASASPRNVRLFRRVFCRLCVCPDRPYGGQNNNQALCGHHSLRAGNHRTLQAFYHQPPSWGAETWHDVHRIQRDEETLSDHGGIFLPCNGRPCNDHPAYHRDVHRDDSCPDRTAKIA